MTSLENLRRAYIPQIPDSLRQFQCKVESVGTIRPEISALFPHLCNPMHRKTKEKNTALKIGVVFSGGPAAGGHNVLSGLFDGLLKGSKLIGFLGGFAGLLKGECKELTAADIDSVRNMGGFDLIGTGRTKLESTADLQKAAMTLQGFDALIVIGGDDSNTNGAMLAEYLLKEKSSTSVIGVPKTIDGDLRSAHIEMSFGFDSATKTYAELIGNVCKDALSTRKYYHFIKLMGRSASHIALECAWLTQPNLTFLGEEKKSLTEVVKEITRLILRRKAVGKEFGVLLIPEGLIEFMPDMQVLSPSTLKLLPEKIQKQLLQSKDPHGNVKVSQISTEGLLITLVKQELEAQNVPGEIHCQEHFFGYEGRSCLPTNFDANYAYSLGFLAALGAKHHLTGVICSIGSLHKPAHQWVPKFSSLLPLMHMEERLGMKKAVIEKVLVDLKGSNYLNFQRAKPQWEVEDRYQFPGPIQFFGPPALTDACPRILSDL